MPRLTIDSIEIEVPAGTLVIEAARQAGIFIPHFCYHPALGNAGACRMCAVKVVEGPVKGLQMSCMLPVQDGMVISTTDPDAVSMRRHVIEWLMINHPHDCPVCDEGGECLLQDYTIAGGHGIRRYRGKKRTHTNQYLGETIRHEMNRCIQCYRCVRFYQDFAGGTDLGVLGRAAMIYFGRFEEGSLCSPFSGNLVDICPTGVYTDRTARYRARYWDYDMAPSVCPHCSLGCATIPAARYRELLKTMARRNDAVNGWFICDKGRFDTGGVNSPDRPRAPLVDGREVPWGEALDTLAGRIREFSRVHGAGSLALVGSPRMSLEGALMLARMAEQLGLGALCYFIGDGEASAACRAVSLLNRDNALSMADLAGSDCIAVAGCDLLEEGPMLLLAVRQAWRRGAKVYLAGGETPPGQLEAVSVPAETVASLADVPFDDYTKPAIISGPHQCTGEGPAQLNRPGIGLMFPLSGPNAFGAAFLSSEHSGQSLAAAVASGRICGIIAFEADIPVELISGMPLLAAADRLRTDAVKKAGIVLPVTAWVEMDGTFVNSEGRAQRFRRVMHPGVPVKGPDPAHHPPRVHRQAPPGGDIRPSWRVIADLMVLLGGAGVNGPLSGRWSELQDLDPEGGGVSIL